MEQVVHLARVLENYEQFRLLLLSISTTAKSKDVKTLRNKGWDDLVKVIRQGCDLTETHVSRELR